MRMDILTIGEAMAELSASMQHQADPLSASQKPENFSGKMFSFDFAGDAYNTAVAAARLGSQVGFITAVGQDPFANALLQTLRQEKIHTDWIKTLPLGFTGVYFCFDSHPEQPDPRFCYYRKGSAASQLNESQIPIKAIQQSKILFSTGVSLSLSGETRKAILKAFKIAKENNVMTAFDPNYRAKLWRNEAEAYDAMNALLPYVDIILTSTPGDTQPLIGFSKPSQIIEFFSFKNIKLVVVKAGSDGCYLGYKKQVEHIPALPADNTKPIHPVGAGDAFNGGFLHGLAEQRSLIDCARLASVVSGLKVQAEGTVAALPYRNAAYERAFLSE